MLPLPESLRLPFWLVIVALPGVYGWWTGRAVLRHRDDPAFEQRLIARRTNVFRVSGVALALLILSAGSLWWILFIVLSTLAGGFPVRRALFNETWTLGHFLLFQIRATLAGFLPWLVIAWIPSGLSQLLPFAGREPFGVARLALAALFVIIALVLERNTLGVWTTLTGARPFEHSALRARFDEIIARAGIAAPQILELAPPGGRMPNAFAIPGADHTAVVLGRDLVTQLSSDEITGIFAHELAHLEYYSRRRLRNFRWQSDAFVIAGAVLGVLVAGPARSYDWLLLFWPLLTIVMLARRLSHRQSHETDSDLRALELTGNADALIGGLTAVHTLARLPRRWSPEFEERATHPSLARRIQKIREAAGVPHEPAFADAATDLVIVRSSDASRAVAFEHGRAWWFDGLPADASADLAGLQRAAQSVRSVAYERLSQLRVSTTAKTYAIVATEKGGATWSVPIAATDVAGVERLLDRIDTRLATPDARIRPISLLLYSIATLIAFSVGGAYLSALILTLLIVLLPSPAVIAASGAMLLLRAIFLAGGWSTAWPLVPVFAAAAIMLLAAGYSGWLLWKYHGRIARKAASAPVAIVVLTIFALWAAVHAEITVHGGGMLDLALGDTMFALSVSLVGLAAALFTRTERKWRVFAWIIGAFALVITPMAFLQDRIAGLPSVRSETRAITDSARVALPTGVWDLHVSPSGNAFAVRLPSANEDDDEGALTSRFAIGTMDKGVAREVKATAVGFAGEDRVLLLDSIADGAFAVRCESVAGSSCGSDTVRRVYDPDFHTLPDGRWWVLGFAADEGDSLVLVTGSPLDSPQRRTWNTVAPHIDPMVFDGGATLLASRSEQALPARAYRYALPLLGSGMWHSSLWQYTDAGVHAVNQLPGWPVCESDLGQRAVCATRGETRGAVLGVDSRGRMTPLAALPTSRATIAIGSDLRVAVAPYGDDHFFVIDPRTGSAVRFVAAHVLPVPVAIAPVTDGVMLLAYDHSHTVLTRLRSRRDTP